LHIEAYVRKLRGERGRDEESVLFRVGEELLDQAVFVMGAFDRESRDARAQPADAVLSVSSVVDRWRSSSGGEKSKLVERYPVEEWKENLAERPVR